jgi:hypothetical protein
MNLTTTVQPTMKFSFNLAIRVWLVFATTSAPAFAGDDHDHGEQKPIASGPASPRFFATSDLFELVGILDNKRLTLYVDDAATNVPVKGATLELEINGEKLKVEPLSVGEFQVNFAQLPKPGVMAISATILAGKNSDLLASELDTSLGKTVGTKATTDAHGHDHGPGEFHLADYLKQYRAGLIAAAGGVLLLGIGLYRRHRAKRAVTAPRFGNK